MGEQIPCESSSFDLAIVDNCIDHVRDVTGVMREIARVLRPGGTLYLTVNCRTTWGFLVHRALSRLRIDAGHPHTFTPARLTTLVAGTPLGLRAVDVESATQARRADLESHDVKSRVKGLLGSSEFSALLVAERTEAHAGSQRAAVRQ